MRVFTILISRVHTTTQLFKILEMAFLRHQVIIYIQRCSFLKEYNHTHCIHTWLLQWPYCLGQGENCNLLWRPNSHVHYQPTLAPVYRNHISQTSIYARCGTKPQACPIYLHSAVLHQGVVLPDCTQQCKYTVWQSMKTTDKLQGQNKQKSRNWKKV